MADDETIISNTNRIPTEENYLDFLGRYIPITHIIKIKTGCRLPRCFGDTIII